MVSFREELRSLARTYRAPALPPPEDFEGRIDVVLPMRNEGDEIVHTIRSMRHWKAPKTRLRFIVIDDGSTDGCGNKVRRAHDVLYVRHIAPQGEGYCRNLGVCLTIDDPPRGYVTLDAHMRATGKYPLESLVLAAERTGGLVCAQTGNIDREHDFHGYGGRFAWHMVDIDRHRRAGLRMSWAYDHKCELQPVQAVYGASYCWTPETFRRLGGWLDTIGAYGYGEPALCIKAYFLDIPRHCHTGVRLLHKFRVQRPYSTPASDYWRNYVWCNRILFGDEAFEEVFWPLAARRDRDGALRALARHPMALELNAAFQKRKLHTDEECLKWMRVPHPDRTQSIITTIYAPNERMEKVVLASLSATTAEFPDDEKFAAIDAATPAIEAFCRRNGWNMVKLREGSPPRMGSLLRKALQLVRTNTVWTIEHDVEVRPGARETLAGLLPKHPQLAGIECMTVDGAGKPFYPATSKQLRPLKDAPGVLAVYPIASLCCVAWRTQALRDIDWPQVPDYPACDRAISRLLRAAGWEIGMTRDATARHHFAGARRWLP